MALHSKVDYQGMVESQAFKDVLSWLEQTFERPHLEAKPPTELLPNYAVVYAATAAQYRVVRDLKKMLDKRTKPDK